MDDDPTTLDNRRGAAGRRATDLRRLRARLEADQAVVRASQSELEVLLASTPATSLWEAVETARYLLELFADGASAADPSRRRLIARTLSDLDRLASLNDAPSTQTREKRAIGKSGRGGSGLGGSGRRPPAAAGRKKAGVVTAMEAHRKPPVADEAPNHDTNASPDAPGDAPVS